MFHFAFREADHKLFVELINDEGYSISIGRARTAFFKVLDSFKPPQFEELSAFIVPRSNAVDQVLSTPRMRRLEITLNIPNPDDLSDDKQQLLAEIDEMHAKKLKVEATKRAGEDTLTPSRRFRAMAELASENGYVKANGKTEDGENIERSTRDYPTEIETPLPDDASRGIMTRRIAERGDE